MKKIVVLGVVLSTLVSCTNAMVNNALKRVGAYDEEIKLKKITSPKKEVVFFPMVHLSTPKFYADVQHKVDSLKSKGYFFLYEYVEKDKDVAKNLQYNKKIMKIGLPTGRKYSQIFKERFKEYDIKLKKEVVDQPLSHEMGLNKANSSNADISKEELLRLYEQKYGEIVLNA